VLVLAMARPPVQFARARDGVELCYEDYAGPAGALPVLFQHGYTSYRGAWLRVVAALRGRCETPPRSRPARRARD